MSVCAGRTYGEQPPCWKLSGSCQWDCPVSHGVLIGTCFVSRRVATRHTSALYKGLAIAAIFLTPPHYPHPPSSFLLGGAPGAFGAHQAMAESSDAGSLDTILLYNCVLFASLGPSSFVARFEDSAYT